MDEDGMDGGPAGRERGGTSKVARWSAVCAVLGAIVIASGFVLGITGHQVHNVFSNISMGLSGGGGGGGSEPAAVAADAGNGGSGASAASSGSQSAAAPGGGLDLGKPAGKIERDVTASYVVPHGEFVDAFHTVVNDAAALGGYVMSSSTDSGGGDRVTSGSVVLKVPTDKLSTFLNELPSSFTAAAIDFSSVDHTKDYVDVQARLTQAQAKLAALQRALANTNDPNQIASLQQQIDALQQQIETAQGQAAVIDDAVTDSTATIRIREADAQPAPVAQAPPRILGGLESGFDNDIAIAAFMVFALLTAAPFLLVGLVLYLLRRRLRRLLGLGGPREEAA